MKNTDIIKKSIIFSLGFCFTTLFFVAGYAAWSSLTTVTTSDSLSSTKWNELVNSINNIGLRVDGIGQVGNNVGIGTNSPTQKLQVAGTIFSTTGGFRFPDGTTQTTAATAQATTTVTVLTSNCITKSGNQGTENSAVSCDAGYQVTGGGTWRNGCGDFIGTAPSGNGRIGRVEPCSSTSYVICCQTQTIKVIP